MTRLKDIARERPSRIKAKSLSITEFTPEQDKRLLVSVENATNADNGIKVFCELNGIKIKSAERRYLFLKRQEKEKKKITKEVSKFSPKDNAYSKEEVDLIVSEMSVSDNHSSTAKELSSVLNRTVDAIKSKYHYETKRKDKAGFEVIIDDASKQEESSYIPKGFQNTLLEEVTTTAYVSLDGEYHFNKIKAIQSNVRTILDSMPDSNADDRTMHLWFFENKEKVNYLTNLNPSELW